MNLPPDVEGALGAWLQRLRDAGITARSTLEELESHVREHVMAAMQRGADPQVAVAEAIARLGGPEKLKVEFSLTGTDRRLPHPTAMWIGVGVAALMVGWFCFPWYSVPRWIRTLGNVGKPVCLYGFPLVLAYATYHAAAWRTEKSEAGEAVFRLARRLRISIWVMGGMGLVWWSVALDWLASLATTYGLILALLVQGGAIAGLARYTKRRAYPDLLAAAALIALVVSAAWTSWPTKILFHLSRARLEALAARVEAGERIETVVWAGGFRIARSEQRNANWGGGTCLWVIPLSGGPTGLVRRGPADKREPGNNINRRVRLDEKWYYVSED